MARSKQLIFGILVLALVARAGAFLFTGGILMEGEGRVQADLAANLLSGKGFTLSYSMLEGREGTARVDRAQESIFAFYRRVDGLYGVLRPGRPTLFFVPGCAVFQAMIFAFFGAGNLIAVTTVQLLLGVFTVFLGVLLARRFLEGIYFLLAATVIALDPFELYVEAVPATQALFSLLFLAGLLLSIEAIDSANRKRLRYFAPLAGLVWALAFYVRPVALPFVPWLAAVLLFRGKFKPRVVLYALLMIAVFFLALSPWGFRNREISGSFRIMPTQGGVNLWEFNGRIFSSHFSNELRGATIMYDQLREEYAGRLESPELAEFPEFRDESEWVRDSVLYDRTLEFLGRNPTLVPRLVSIRFAEFFKPFPLNSFSFVFTLAGLASFFWVLLFMVSGSLRLLSGRTAVGIFLTGSVWGYVLMHLITATGTPHRVAIDFPLIVIATIGLRTAVLRFQAGRTR